MEGGSQDGLAGLSPRRGASATCSGMTDAFGSATGRSGRPCTPGRR